MTVFFSTSYTLCTLSCLKSKDLFSSKTSSPPFSLLILSATEMGPALTQVTDANDGSLKKSFLRRSFSGLWKLEMYKVTPFTFGSSNDSIFCGTGMGDRW